MMKINKFWAKMKMMFVGVGLMSIFTFTLTVISDVFQLRISRFIFIAIAFISAIISGYSNYRRMKELKEFEK